MLLGLLVACKRKYLVSYQLLFYLLEIRFVPRVDIVDLDTTVLVVFEILHKLVGVRLTPVTTLTRGVGDTAKGAAVVVSAYVTMSAIVRAKTTEAKAMGTATDLRSSCIRPRSRNLR